MQKPVPIRQRYAKQWNFTQTANLKTGLLQKYKALKEKNAGQLFKAYLTKASKQEELTPDSAYTHYAQMEEWVKQESDALNRAVLHSLLAERYADYLRCYAWMSGGCLAMVALVWSLYRSCVSPRDLY